MTPQQRAERRWNRAISAKVGLGFALAAAAPFVAIIADRARVTRNAIRLGRTK